MDDYDRRTRRNGTTTGAETPSMPTFGVRPISMTSGGAITAKRTFAGSNIATRTIVTRTRGGTGSANERGSKRHMSAP